jgi:hypothetical protein
MTDAKEEEEPVLTTESCSSGEVEVSLKVEHPQGLNPNDVVEPQPHASTSNPNEVYSNNAKLLSQTKTTTTTSTLVKCISAWILMAALYYALRLPKEKRHLFFQQGMMEFMNNEIQSLQEGIALVRSMTVAQVLGSVALPKFLVSVVVSILAVLLTFPFPSSALPHIRIQWLFGWMGMILFNYKSLLTLAEQEVVTSKLQSMSTPMLQYYDYFGSHDPMTRYLQCMLLVTVGIWIWTILASKASPATTMAMSHVVKCLFLWMTLVVGNYYLLLTSSEQGRATTKLQGMVTEITEWNYPSGRLIQAGVLVVGILTFGLHIQYLRQPNTNTNSSNKSMTTTSRSMASGVVGMGSKWLVGWMVMVLLNYSVLLTSTERQRATTQWQAKAIELVDLLDGLFQEAKNPSERFLQALDEAKRKNHVGKEPSATHVPLTPISVRMDLLSPPSLPLSSLSSSRDIPEPPSIPGDNIVEQAVPVTQEQGMTEPEVPYESPSEPQQKPQQQQAPVMNNDIETSFPAAAPQEHLVVDSETAPHKANEIISGEPVPGEEDYVVKPKAVDVYSDVIDKEPEAVETAVVPPLVAETNRGPVPSGASSATYASAKAEPSSPLELNAAKAAVRAVLDAYWEKAERDHLSDHHRTKAEETPAETPVVTQKKPHAENKVDQELHHAIASAKAGLHTHWEHAQAERYWTKAEAEAQTRAAEKAKKEHQAEIWAAREAMARAEAEARAKNVALERAKAESEAREKAETEARARAEAEERKRQEAREIVEALSREKARAEAQAKAEAEAAIQAALEATAKAAEEARAGSAKKGGAIRRFIGERLFAATPPPAMPEATMANTLPSRSKGPIRGFLHRVLKKNKRDEK